jgi:uncharacterized phage protein gp47/JayE
MDFPRYPDLFEVALKAMLANDNSLTEEVIRTPGTAAYTIASLAATMGQELVYHIACVARDRLLSTAKGEELDRLVYDWFGLLRKPAAAATCKCKFTCSTTGTLNSGIKVGTSDNKEYILTDTILFSKAGQSLYGTVVCTQTGEIGNTKANTITQILSSIFDPNMVVTNEESAVGGCDIESDDSLRERARSFWQTIQRGTLLAIQNGALTVPQVAKASVYETNITDPQNNIIAKIANLAISAQNEGGNQALVDLVKQEIENWRPAGVYVNIFACEVLLIDTIKLQVSWRVGANVEQAKERIKTNIVNFVNNMEPGQIFEPNILVGIILQDSAVAKVPLPAVLTPDRMTPKNTQVFRTNTNAVVFV